MIKTFALLALLSSVFASNDWIRTWYVFKPSSNDYTVCDVPSYLTIANITLNPDNTLTLNGMQLFHSQPRNWTLNWEYNSSFGHFCQEDGWCVNGTLTTEQGVLYANISWYNLNNLDASCGVVMTPANMFWTGKWMVMESYEGRYCPVPQNATVVEILAFREQLLMIGVDSTTGLVSSWTLNFTAKAQDTSACIEAISMCTNADINIVDYVLCGNINWFAYSIQTCSVVLARVPNKFNIGDEAKDILESFAPRLSLETQANSNAEDPDVTVPLGVSEADLTEDRLEDLIAFLA